MQAILVEGVAGSGKTSYIADFVRDSLYPSSALLLTFSRTGRAVSQLYLQNREVQNTNVFTIDAFAMKLLRQLGDNRFLLRREVVETDILPDLYEQVAWQLNQQYAFNEEELIHIPPVTPQVMKELMNDIDYFRATCAFEYEDDDDIRTLLADKLNHHWRLVRRLFYAYDALRQSWLPSTSEADDTFFDVDIDDTSILRQGELGFRIISEAVYDLLEFVEDSTILSKLAKSYPLQCIDEFHDTTPLQLKFILKLAEQAQQVIAVGDRFQNIFAWRGTNTGIVFDDFTRCLHAKVIYLNHSYRYAQNVANIAKEAIQRPIESRTKYGTDIKEIDTAKFAKLHRETVIITQDIASQIKASFALIAHTKFKVNIALHKLMGPAILNVLVAIRYAYLTTPNSKFSKNIGESLSQFLQLPQCVLNTEAKVEMLKKPSMDSIRMYFATHLDSDKVQAYSTDMKKTLLYWCSVNVEHAKVIDIMEWFERNARLWSNQYGRLYSSINKASWDALKEDARYHGYTLAQWVERAELLAKRWSTTEGIRIVTVSQAKGREYDNVLVYNADKKGFNSTKDDLARNQFYIAITRSKKQLLFYTVTPEVNSEPSDDVRSLLPSLHPEHVEKAVLSTVTGTQKQEALKELALIKASLKKRLEQS